MLTVNLVRRFVIVNKKFMVFNKKKTFVDIVSKIWLHLVKTNEDNMISIRILQKRFT